MSDSQSAVNYTNYLAIDDLLQLQRPVSEGPEHDEMLFIVIHQVYELWFKQLLHEIDAVKVALETGEAFDRHLPATRNELALHAAKHEQPQDDRRCGHPDRAGGQPHFASVDREQLRDRFDGELVHGVEFTGLCGHARHSKTDPAALADGLIPTYSELPLPREAALAIRKMFLKATMIPRASIPNKPQGDVPAKRSISHPINAPPSKPPSNSANTRLPSR